MKKPIYLDYNATTPVDQRVVDAMLPYFTDSFGNAASKTHAYGWIASKAIENARTMVAELIHSEPGEIVFTSGATESINLAIKGVYEAYQSKGNHFVTVTTEHKAVLDSMKRIERAGAEITLLGVTRDGLIDLNELKQSLRKDTVAVSIMAANNETGVMQPMRELSEIVHRHGALLMCDATQAAGKMVIDVQNWGADLLCLSSHKMYGPKGAGALYVRRRNPRVRMVAQMDGGGHENGLRSGTLNVPGIIGFGKACEIALNEQTADVIRMKYMRELIESQLIALGGIRINGSVTNRLPNTSNVCLEGVRASELIKHCQDVAFATGSACSSALMEPSHVLKAMGLTAEESYSSVRISLGKNTTETEAGQAGVILCKAIAEMRN